MPFHILKSLRKGMLLEKDLYFYDPDDGKIRIVAAGQALTQHALDLLFDQGVSGAYVREPDGEDFDLGSIHAKESPITAKVKLDAVDNVKSAFLMLSDPGVDPSLVVDKTRSVARDLVSALVDEEGMLVNLIDLRVYDDCTYNHSLGVSVISVAIGAGMGLDKDALSELGTCALLHDIGKMRIPVEIIDKPSALTPEEYKIVQTHADLGADFLKEQGLVPAAIYSSVRAHHEKFDGTGYLHRLTGKSIPLYARILSVADVYDALTAMRPYRRPARPQDVVEYIMGGSGTAFDYDVVKAFLSRISPFPIGSCVLLSNQKLAVVTRENTRNPLRPWIRVLDNVKDEVDLSERMDFNCLVILDSCRLSLSDVVTPPVQGDSSMEDDAERAMRALVEHNGPPLKAIIDDSVKPTSEAFPIPDEAFQDGGSSGDRKVHAMSAAMGLEARAEAAASALEEPPRDLGKAKHRWLFRK